MNTPGQSTAPNRFSLTRRVTLWVLGTVALMWLSAGVIVWWDASHEVLELVERLPQQSDDFSQVEHDRREVMSSIIEGLLWPLAIGLPIVALLVIVVIYRSFAPLRRLCAVIGARKADSLQPINTDGLPDEVLPVVKEVNGLFARVSKGIELEKRFTADAAHELRTPIAAIRAQAQVAGMAELKQDQDHALAQVMQGCDRAGHLIEQLLALSRLDGHAPLPAAAAVDLVDLVRQTMIEVAGRSDHDWQLTGDTHATVWIRAPLWHLVLRNLLDNAKHYSPTGRVIRVTITVGARATQCVIADAGPGLTDAQRERLGERFFRVDPNSGVGSGLGWSIVRRIAEHEQTALQVGKSIELGGLEVKFELPNAVP